MQINFDMGQIAIEQEMFLQECKKYFQCEGCPMYNGQQMQIGNSTFTCENIGKGANK